MDFLDDLLNFGAGALESVGEHASWLFGGGDNSSNPYTSQQPNHPAVDNNGNPITTPQGSWGVTNNTMLLYAGGIALLVIVIVLLAKGK